MQETVNMRIDKKTHRTWGILAEKENRTKADELRYLVNERAKTLKIKEGSQ